MGIILRESSP